MLNSLLDFAGIPREMSHGVFRVLDKLDKIGLDGVTAELTAGRIDASGDKITGLKLTQQQVDRIKEFLAIPKGNRREVLGSLSRLFAGVPSGKEALDELGTICDMLESLGIPDERIALDPSLARGLDYYTGPVFEAVLLDAPEFGSVFGGGRYEGLVERFLGRKIPGVGASIGVDRLLAAMQKLGLVELAASTAQVLVTVMEPARSRNTRCSPATSARQGSTVSFTLARKKGWENSSSMRIASRSRLRSFSGAMSSRRTK